MPATPMDFMIKWLRRRCGSSAAGNRQSMVQQNANLKQQVAQCQGLINEAAAGTTNEPEKDEEEEEEEEDDEMDDLPEHMRRNEDQMGKARASVSAEAYGQWNQKKAFQPPMHPKSPDQSARLKATLTKSFLFQALDEKDMNIILGAMQEVQIEAGKRVITEGEDGTYLFVIEEGALECKKSIDGEEKVVKTCNAGDVFGELALLYNCPRAASVDAKDKCICWQLDRDTFTNIVSEAATKRRNMYDGFLKSVNLLNGLDAYERSQIADALKRETFNKGDIIVKQDEPGDKFYILEEGMLSASKSDGDGGEKKVMEYKPGDYFGELALLKNQPRAASIKVESETAKVLSLGRASFKKMLGPLQDLLQSSSSKYN
eukprot:gnl/TRDRNA2_/TRDRNA2_185942_c0_seq1.p1 gnl/TRDRNA2_/TRDRNA2_185942_c0~~gnl/TRDRNA2_/TRDRNA2_185942_c0_seq1.p1  ORF type:complete len:434 (-),score=126.89 gnl/TRDRNA2_/TRDRNA2_185942_c0_seq1:83-1201(-)